MPPLTAKRTRAVVEGADRLSLAQGVAPHSRQLHGRAQGVVEAAGLPELAVPGLGEEVADGRPLVGPLREHVDAALSIP